MQKIIPAILTNDPQELDVMLNALKEQTNWVHIDIIDGKFVENTTVNLFALEEAHQYFNLEIHLMVQNPEKYFEDCEAIGAKRVIFHYEATNNIEKVLQIGALKFQLGIALNPETSADVLKNVQGKFDTILLMSVHPGFQGQPFAPEVLGKIKNARELFSNLTLGVDGAVSKENIKEIFSAGASYVTIGSRIVRAENPGEALREFEQMVQ